jgi:hypothetical protein
VHRMQVWASALSGPKRWSDYNSRRECGRNSRGAFGQQIWESSSRSAIDPFSRSEIVSHTVHFCVTQPLK